MKFFILFKTATKKNMIFVTAFLNNMKNLIFLCLYGFEPLNIAIIVVLLALSAICDNTHQMNNVHKMMLKNSIMC